MPHLATAWPVTNGCLCVVASASHPRSSVIMLISGQVRGHRRASACACLLLPATASSVAAVALPGVAVRMAPLSWLAGALLGCLSCCCYCVLRPALAYQPAGGGTGFRLPPLLPLLRWPR